MIELANIANFLEQFAPSRLAESWDNVGLLVGRRNQLIERIMTCLTITPDTAVEAIERGANLIVSHHPLPFKPLDRVTSDTTAGSILLDLIRADIAVYSPHTAFDSARDGINQSLARGLSMRGIGTLVPEATPAQVSPCAGALGAGRWGWLDDEMTLGQLMERVKRFLNVERVRWVGDRERTVRTVGIACGAADEFLDVARRLGCDAMIIGETRFHTCLEAEASGIGLILPGHYASERFAVEKLSEVLSQRFPRLTTWSSRTEHNPIQSETDAF